MLDFLQTDSGCTISVLFFRDEIFFLHSSHKWVKKSKGKSTSRCYPDYSTAKQLGVRFESVTNQQKDIKPQHHPHTLICISLHIPVPCYSSTEGLGRKCGIASCFVRKSGHLYAPNGGGKACFKNGTTAHTQLSKFLQDAAPALWYNLHFRGGGC